MVFDWLEFFDKHHIEYTKSGANVSKGNVAIHCAYCGSADESRHMSVSLDGKGWRCLRRPIHSGKSAARLVQALLKCSLQEAQRLTGGVVYINDFMREVQASFNKSTPVKATTLKLPKEFKPLSKLPSCRPYLNYLQRRGFSLQQLAAFDLYYSTRGPYSGRVIFPIYHEGKLVTWTSRSIYPKKLVGLRYKTLSVDPDKAQQSGLAPAIGPITQYLLWFDQLLHPYENTICLCEGPFDALKVTILGKGHDICATCFFTSSPSNAQIELLHEILPKFTHRFLMLDQGTLPASIETAGKLQALDVVIKQLPPSIKDPGDLQSLEQLQEILSVQSTKKI